MSRDELAKAVGITRQSVRLIETGEVCPSALVALRIAKVLATTVEEIIADNDSREVEARLIFQDATHEFQPRVYVSELGGEWVARSANYEEVDFLTQPVHGIANKSAYKHDDRLQVKLFQRTNDVARTVFVSGCEIGLGLLSHYAGSRSATERAIWFNRSNRQALRDLESSVAHIAAIHYSPEQPLEWTGSSMHIFHFVREEMGWIVPAGNPQGVKGAQDLLSGRLRLINRERGSGARDFLDAQLRAVNAVSANILGYNVEAHGHLSVAAAVANKMADVGVGHASAAAALGLSFIPVQQETCVLLIPDSLVNKAPIQNFLETLMTDRFRMELQSLAPYDISQTGMQIHV